MEKDFSDLQNNYNFQNTFDTNELYRDPMLVQYEQAYSYYKYLCMQMDYKIKCKEYEKLCLNTTQIKNS